MSGNTATGNGGGGIQFNAKYQAEISNSVISGNTGPDGGGMLLSVVSYLYTSVVIRDTTISGNHGPRGAGLEVSEVFRGNHVLLDRVTVSGNDGGPSSFGGGILFDKYLFGEIEVRNSTVSGNTATAGAGVSVGSDVEAPLMTKYNGPGGEPSTGSLTFANSTVAANTASAHGGGIYLGQYDSNDSTPVKKSATVALASTIAGDNTAAGAAEDLDRIDTSTSGGFDGAFSLVERPGDAPLTRRATLVGIDPALGALTDNGGPTRTMLPAGTSPVLDQGRAPLNLLVDQRGQPRTVQTDLADPAGGDGTDIGAVELAKAAVVIPPPPPPPPAPPTQAFTVTLQGGLLGGSSTPLLVAGFTPVNCLVSFGGLSSCVIEVRAAKDTKAGSVTLPAGKLLANGSATGPGDTPELETGVTLTQAGRALLEHRPLGADVSASVVGGADNSQTAGGMVHLLHSPYFNLATRTRSPTLSKPLLRQLERIAGLIPDARSVTCTAWTDRGRRDRALTTTQAEAACSALAGYGLNAKLKSVGRGHSNPVAPYGSPGSRRANRRLRISFRP